MLTMVCSSGHARVRTRTILVVCPDANVQGAIVSHEDCWMAHEEPVRDTAEVECSEALDQLEAPGPEQPTASLRMPSARDARVRGAPINSNATCATEQVRLS